MTLPKRVLPTSPGRPRESQEPDTEPEQLNDDIIRQSDHPVMGIGSHVKSADDLVKKYEIDAESILREGILSRRVVSKGGRWSKKYITLTKTHLFVRNQEQGEVREAMDLLNITHAKLAEGHHQSIRSFGVLKQRESITAKQAGKSLVEPTLSRSNSESELQNMGDSNDMSRTGSAPLRSMRELLWENVIEIYLEYHGRTYYFKAESRSECTEWIAAINEARQDAESEYHKLMDLSTFERVQLAARNVCNDGRTEMSVAFLLLANFIINIIQVEVSSNPGLMRVFDLINTIFTLVYALELSINVVGNWFWDFIRSPWNVFDLIIVVMSLFDTIYIMAGAKG
jgi:hypothetical protein